MREDLNKSSVAVRSLPLSPLLNLSLIPRSAADSEGGPLFESLIALSEINFDIINNSEQVAAGSAETMPS